MKNHFIAALMSLAMLSPAAHSEPAGAPAAESAAAKFKQVELAQLVANSKTETAGQRIIFAPVAVKFRAVLSDLPKQQKADYLKAALAAMQFSSPPQVRHRIGLDYGSEKALAAYIEESAAERMAKTLKPGDSRTFYAYHVYNNNRGPALLVVSFGD
ncbi:MAG: hypothetical protein PHX38_00690 [Sulfuricella sp.]|nr:hypothetical protein [Sulfuricella sp.]